ncbi:ABC transporter ATP-binding protein [Lujinxingia sediminis]|uniref:ABC transporter ATP-binding protein n=1 Tax=Lujinxingia sediminis TaxID=2480984 RepID=A0ABY0CNW5_9DELT|nr:ABC transporter ATP-binding protein [Lujinxingia sediminis]RVU42144.1 ABC transporter ATP-binding protein [Lujinxingia sediminis]
MPLLRQIWSLFDPRQRRELLGLFALMLIGAGFEALGVGIVMPFISLINDPSAAYDIPLAAELLNTLGVSTANGVVMAAGLALLVTFSLKNLVLGLMYHLKFRFVFDNQVRLSRRLFGAYLYSPYAFHLHRNSAQLLRNVNEEVRLSFVHVVIPLLTLAVELMVVGVIALLLAAVEPFIAPVAMLSFGLVSYGFYRGVRQKSAVLGKAQQHHAGQMIQWVNQGLGGVKEAQLLGVQDFFLDTYTEHSTRYARAMRFHSFIKEIPRHVIETMGLGGMILVVLLLIARGQPLTQILPVLGLFAMAAVRMMPSLTRIIAALTSIRHFRPSVEVIAADLEALRSGELAESVRRSESHTPSTTHAQDVDFTDIPNKNTVEQSPLKLAAAGDAETHRRALADARQHPRPLEHELRLHHVSYTYPESATPSLHELDLRIERGQSVAFVGPSGAGKTTCVDLILGLLPPDLGQILVDGQNIHAELASWQASLGYIAQPVYLMDDTIRRNIAFGLPDDTVNDEEVWRALEDARLASTIAALPRGLDTEIGEGGVRLSGGQRQRLGIARALYRRPDLLVLDEATSALDNTTEREITRAIERLSGRITLIIIAHRLSTVRHCDRLFVLDQGRLIDQGTYDELAARCPTFQQMVQAAEMPPSSLPGARQLRLK